MKVANEYRNTEPEYVQHYYLMNLIYKEFMNVANVF